MHLSKLPAIIVNVLLAHKLYSVTVFITLFLLLIRIPLGTFNDTSSIDTFGHFVLPATAAPLVFMTLVRSRFLPSLTSTATIVVMTLLGTTMEVIWEIIEFCVDRVLPWRWQLSNEDTMIDLILAVVGSLVGAILFLMIYKKNKLTM